MNTPHLPLQYTITSPGELHSHIHYCVTALADKETADIFLPDAWATIPVIKNTYRKKPATLNLIMRSGSLGRETLEWLYEELLEKQYVVKAWHTKKKKLIRRISVSLTIDDPALAAKASDALSLAAVRVTGEWPCKMVVGYPVGLENNTLPGEFRYRNPVVQLGYRLGKLAGRMVGKLMGKD